MIHELQEYTRYGFEITFYRIGLSGMQVKVRYRDKDEIVYDGWSFGESLFAMDNYMENGNE